jgi:uncharacterized MAPEG superfamily protein
MSVAVGSAAAYFFLAYVPVICKAPLVFASAKAAGKGELDTLMAPRAAFAEAAAKVGSPEEAEKSRFLHRAQACHDNMLEGGAWFFGALLFAMLAGVPQKNVDTVALVNISARMLYVWLYLTGTVQWKAAARSSCFFACVASCTYLFVHAAVAAPPRTW